MRAFITQVLWWMVLLCCAIRLTAGPVVVIAHRGNHEQAYENTLEAIRDAGRVGADYVEMDVRRTKDGFHVLMHDRRLERTTDGEGEVRSFLLAEVRSLVVGEVGREGVAGSRVPTFEEALDALGPSLGVYLDFKEGDPSFLVAELGRRGLLERTVVYLEPEEIDEWRRVAPGLRFIVSLPNQSRTVSGVREFLGRYPGVILDGPVTDYTAEMVREAHELGSLVWPDIQNPGEDPDQWGRALELGVDGLQTDHPSGLLEYLRRMGRHGGPPLEIPLAD
ncbi:MAG: hypothetical protein RI897_1635 [Verrucomicrobiota bacterium]|jgi:glycerophosphoryl diester phosphodiesterase